MNDDELQIIANIFVKEIKKAETKVSAFKIFL